ncbi:hypothetical protein SELMODRAFT_415772 [Selaginella moellendorffii]|uniref:Uncharacterized protein n=1 Tax=Selaginella moellendorffii TaxID=88036 RepID=D8RX71_SELML|nr:hypothetical protein SELMODRAFT_415772 [Selaginella moellendorffii]
MWMDTQAAQCDRFDIPKGSSSCDNSWTKSRSGGRDWRWHAEKTPKEAGNRLEARARRHRPLAKCWPEDLSQTTTWICPSDKQGECLLCCYFCIIKQPLVSMLHFGSFHGNKDSAKD